MRFILCVGDTLENYKPRKRKKGFSVVLGVILAILLACACALSALGHWSDIKAFFLKEEDHVHNWNVASLKNASCIEDGLVLRHCAECDEEEKTFLYASGHKLIDNVCADCAERASDGLSFTFYTDDNDNPYAVITGIGSCTERNLLIPDVIGGFPVTEIAENAFKGNTELRSVAIHQGVKKIGADAFDGCQNLYTILLPEGLDEFAVLGAFDDTAYANDKANWNENGQLYRQGYLLEEIDEAI